MKDFILILVRDQRTTRTGVSKVVEDGILLFFHFLSRINLNHPVYHDDLIFIIELVLRFMYTPILFLVSSIATSIFNYSIWHTLLPIPKPERTAIGTTLTQTEIGSVLHLSVESIDFLYYPNESF